MSTQDTQKIRIGTRGSPLALAQAYETRDRLRAAHGLAEEDLEIVVISTKGDQILDRPLAEIGGKGLFTMELEEQMLDGRIDIAVHSMKDMPTELPEGLFIPCTLPREDPRDALLTAAGVPFAELPQGSVIGSSSLRRAAQLLSRRPDLKIIDFRGNVQTRMRKLKDGVADATLLAIAGLNRLNMSDAATEVLEPEVLLPAVAQGAIGIECRRGDDRILGLLDAIGCPTTLARVACERSLLAALEGSCRTPIAGLALIEADGSMWLRGLVASLDGKKIWRTERRGAVADAVAMGKDAGDQLHAEADPGTWQKA